MVTVLAFPVASVAIVTCAPVALLVPDPNTPPLVNDTLLSGPVQADPVQFAPGAARKVPGGMRGGGALAAELPPPPPPPPQALNVSIDMQATARIVLTMFPSERSSHHQTGQKKPSPWLTALFGHGTEGRIRTMRINP